MKESIGGGVGGGGWRNKNNVVVTYIRLNVKRNKIEVNEKEEEEK